MKDEHIDIFFRQELKSQEVTPSAEAWANIEKALPGKASPLYRRIWFKTVISAAAIALVIGTSYLYKRSIPATGNESVNPFLASGSPPLITADNSVNTKLNPSKRITESDQQTQPEILPRRTTVRYEKTSESAKNTLVLKNRPVTIAKETGLQQAELKLENELPSAPTKLSTYKVVEIGPIQPLIESPEHEDILLAKTENTSLIPSLLNKISEVINPSENRTIRFSHDEEGSFQLDIHKSYVKSRFKKRK